jgi:hypothetical protein
MSKLSLFCGFLVMTLLSIAWFLYAINIFGFVFTIKCLIGWAFFITVWAIVVAVFLLIFEID